MSAFRRGGSRNVFALSVILILAGCGGNADTGKVTGRVTLDGQPLEGAVVEFHPTAKGATASAGITDEDGYYKLMHTINTPGAKVGEHLVTIRTAAIYYEDEECDCQKEDPIPAMYNETSEMYRTVTASRNSIDFELTTPPSRHGDRRQVGP